MLARRILNPFTPMSMLSASNRMIYSKMLFWNQIKFFTSIPSRTLERKNLIRNSELLPMTANNLWDNEGSRIYKFKVGRGFASGKGKTCGRGMNGQKSRPGGKIPRHFIGGQNPLHKRLPKLGFNRRPFKEPLTVVNIRNLIYLIKKGRLDASKTITMKDLYFAGACRKIQYGVKILGKGAEELKSLNTPVNLEVSDASQTAIDAIKETGGSIKAVYHTETTLKRLLHPEKFANPEAKIPMPKPKKVLKLEKMKDKGIEVIYPKAPWYEEYKAKKEKELKEFEAREKTPGEKILPKYPADHSPGVSLHKPKYEKPELARRYEYPIV